MPGIGRLIIYSVLVATCRSLSANTHLLRSLLNESQYDFTVRPPGVQRAEDPCVVEIDVVLNSVGPISSLDLEFTASFYLRQEWTDPRLKIDDPQLANATIDVSPTYLEQLWVPDLFFTMGKTSYLHELTTPNVLIRLQSDGTLLYSQRLTSTMKCFMDLSDFPHDRQECHSNMMSYSYTTDDVIFKWSSKRKPTAVLPSAFLAEFSLVAVNVDDCTQTFATGTYTCLKAILTLDREMGFYLTQFFIPSILIVMLSWAAFWIDHEAVPARISVGLLTVLTITTQNGGARSSLPRVNYIKAIDVWMAVNLVFVFAAYMEYAVVTVMSRRYKRMLRDKANKSAADGNGDVTSRSDVSVKSDMSDKSESSTNVNLSDLHLNLSGNNEKKQGDPPASPTLPDKQKYMPSSDTSKKSRRKRLFSAIQKQEKQRRLFRRNFGRRVDFHSRYLFPISYTIFSTVYWIVYLQPR